jgi:glycosyltransferase involved in cell wall biosynthesis
MFTVITVTYNSADFLDQCIQSVLAQTFIDFEYIIADDNSSDNSWDIINRYNDPRIKTYRNHLNLGEYPNRTKAINQARGEYVIFIDGDDVMYPHALDVFARYVRQFPSAAMFFSREWDSRILCPCEMNPQEIYQFEYLDGGMMGGNFTKVLFKTDTVRRHTFKTGVRSGDIYMQLLIARTESGVVVPSGLTWWRRRSNNATDRLFRDYRHLAETLNYRAAFLESHCPLSPSELKQAKTNLYGTFLRQLLRLILKGKIMDLFFLLKNAQVPAEYYKSIFKPSRLDFFSHITGDAPLHTAQPKPTTL